MLRSVAAVFGASVGEDEQQRRTVLVEERADAIVERVGRLKGAHSRAARRFHVEIEAREDGRPKTSWTKDESHRAWATLTDGCYVLRSHVKIGQARSYGKRTSG